MKWFRHMANASNDDFIEWLEQEYGLEGYARWWKILETIALAMEKDRSDPSATHTWQKWQTILKGKRSQLLSFLLATANQGRIEVESSEFVLKIKCPKLLKMRDDYSRKSGQGTEQRRTVDTDTDTDIEDNPLPLENDKNQMKPEKDPLPDWMPLPEWGGYVEMRRKIKKPLTRRATEMAIKKLLDFKNRGLDIRKILDQSTFNSWQDLYEPKTNQPQNRYGAVQKPKQEISNYKVL